MRGSMYYVIQPRPVLLERLPEDDGLSLLREPRLWHRSEGGRSVWGVEDHTQLIKLQFLARWVTRDWFSDDERAAIRELFGPPPWRAETFDRWWSIERLSLDTDADAFWDELDVEALALLDGGDNALVTTLLADRRHALMLRTERHRQVLLRLPEAALAAVELLREHFPNALREVALPKDALRQALELVPPVSFVTLDAFERPTNAAVEDDWPAKIDVLQLRFTEIRDLSPERLELRFEFRHRRVEPGETPIYDVFEDHSGTAHVEFELVGDEWSLRNRSLQEKPVHRWRR